MQGSCPGWHVRRLASSWGPVMRSEWAVHGLHARAVLVLVGAWVLTALVARVGIPAVDPRIEHVPRPLETLGTIALALPASLHAAALRNQASWLLAVAPRSACRLRFAWVCSIIATGSVAALAWASTLPPDVPRLHVLAAWLLVLSAAIGSVIVLRHDLAVVLPLLLLAALSTSALVPFELNVIYNVELTGELMVCAGFAVAVTACAFAVCGDRQSRRNA